MAEQTDLLMWGRNFSLKEMVESDTARALGIDNRLPVQYVPNVLGLIQNVLDPLRECYGYPIYINSGYRCAELNDLVGGVKNSFHLTGCAADLDTRRGKAENQRIYEFIRDNLPFTEMGWEGGGQWVHVALVPGRENEKELF